MKFELDDKVIRVNQHFPSVSGSIEVGEMGVVSSVSLNNNIYVVNDKNSCNMNYNSDDFELVWKPRRGDMVEVSDDNEVWRKASFALTYNDIFFAQHSENKELLIGFKYIREIKDREKMYSFAYHRKMYKVTKDEYAELVECCDTISKILY